MLGNDLAFSIVLLLAFLIGASVGSFINVIVYRYRTGARIGMDRSRCMSCGKTLTPLMLIPIVSFLLQKGRCAYCRTKLSVQYPLVEFAGGSILLLVLIRSGILEGAFSWDVLLTGLFAASFFYILLAITVYDWKHKIIPDRFVILLLVAALLSSAEHLFAGERHIIPTLFTGLGIASPFALLWGISRGRWMGLGDAKLALPLGLFIGYPIGLSVPILAFWIGTVPALWLFLGTKGVTMKSEIPFAPFLALATLVLYVYPIDILQLTSIWPTIVG